MYNSDLYSEGVGLNPVLGPSFWFYFLIFLLNPIYFVFSSVLCWLVTEANSDVNAKIGQELLLDWV